VPAPSAAKTAPGNSASSKTNSSQWQKRIDENLPVARSEQAPAIADATPEYRTPEYRPRSLRANVPLASGASAIGTARREIREIASNRPGIANGADYRHLYRYHFVVDHPHFEEATMKVHEPIRFGIDTTSQMVDQMVEDLTDKELLHRPHPACNHLNWQLGHLIVAEHGLIEKEMPGAMPPLPAGFAEKYGMDKTGVDDPKALATKAELVSTMKEQRAGLLKAFEKASDDDLGRKTEGWTPNVGALFLAAASSHWLMHLGQWSVIRRQLGRKPLF
jgi:hypothetical protein